MKKEYAKALLEKTRTDYNAIAKDFSRTRQNPWEEISFLFDTVEDNDVVLDLGCGNGRCYEFIKGKKVKYTGVDNSSELIEIAKKRYSAEFILADALKLPFPNNTFDKVYSIAVLHHFPSKEMRKQFLTEARRVLKPGGMIVLTVWKFHEMNEIKLLLKYTFLKVLGLSELDFKDILEPWANRVKRYYHWFSKKELRKLVKDSGFKVKECKIIRNKRGNRRNIYLVGMK